MTVVAVYLDKHKAKKASKKLDNSRGNKNNWYDIEKHDGGRTY